MNALDVSIKEKDTVLYTPPDGFVAAMKNKSEKMGNHHGLHIYAVRLTKNSKSSSKFHRSVFGKADLSICEHKTNFNVIFSFSKL